uniref:Uncharacterized protein n=1 Tax=Arundo donax TaxID=35708 RepID=A0A0A9M5L9_ARUDO
MHQAKCYMICVSAWKIAHFRMLHKRTHQSKKLFSTKKLIDFTYGFQLMHETD